jgi:hypothetical protein
MQAPTFGFVLAFAPRKSGPPSAGGPMAQVGPHADTFRSSKVQQDQDSHEPRTVESMPDLD